MNKPREIDVHNLSEATEQEVFDHIAWHLLTQNKKSIDTKSTGITCQYKLGELSCAAGCVIPDAFYNPEMEGGDWTNLTAKYSITTTHSELISSLQLLHDWEEAAVWKTYLAPIADRYKLKTQVIEHFKQKGETI